MQMGVLWKHCSGFLFMPLVVYPMAVGEMDHVAIDNAASILRARWRSVDRTVKADAAAQNAKNRPPGHCEIAVVGAGWGGAYFAWRLTIDTKAVSPDNVCVFEANGRVGGRIYSIRDIPHFEDMTVDAGGYRFLDGDMLPRQLIQNALKLPVSCYDWNCQRNCEPNYDPNATCYVISDVYGNNAGYATAIETMLAQIEAEGSGQQVFLGSEVRSVSASPEDGSGAIRLGFQDGTFVVASKVFLNLPHNSLENLANSSMIFAQTSRQARETLNAVKMGVWEDAKVYAYYQDAWWNTRLGLMEGFFKSPEGSPDIAPLMGRYHDGPQKCVVGIDATGKPIYSGKKVRFGNCSGALEVFYSNGSMYYRQFMHDSLSPVAVITARDATGLGLQLLKDVHMNLMHFHAPSFQAHGIDPLSIGGPEVIVVANWIARGKFTPGMGQFLPNTDMARKIVRKPLKDYELYIANVDYGYKQGWAAGSLIMAEKVLQAELGVSPPVWLDADWYRKNVLDKETLSPDSVPQSASTFFLSEAQVI